MTDTDSKLPGGSKSNPLHWLGAELAELAAAGLHRPRIMRGGAQGPQVARAGEELWQFSSNDYLGLAADPAVRAATCAAVEQFGVGNGASPLVSGYSDLQQTLEAELARFLGTPAALVFSSGFAANLGAVTALVGPGDAVFGDRLNHASLVDGCRLSGAYFRTYRHNDVADLEGRLQAAAGYRRRLIATDSLFSMDGDFAPLAELATLAERYDCMLLVDEAHATGVWGPTGRGALEAQAVDTPTVIHMGTLSKALGAGGGFVAGSNELIDWLWNKARSQIFSTALPIPTLAAAQAALRIVQTEPDRRHRLQAHSSQVRTALTEQGWNIGPSASQIIPLWIGDAELAVTVAGQFRAAGCWVPAIRPPAVPRGAARLRISLSSAHSPADLERLLAATQAVRHSLAAAL